MQIRAFTVAVLALASFVPRIAAANQLNVFAGTYSPVKGGSVLVTAQLADGNGLPLADPAAPSTVTWSVSGACLLSSGSTGTNGMGFTSVTLTASPNAGDTCAVTASSTGYGSATTSTLTMSNAAGAGTRYLVTSSNWGPALSGPLTVSAQLVDAQNNPVAASRTVTWNKLGLGGGFASGTSPTNGAGLATVTFTAGAAMTSYVFSALDGSASGSSPPVSTIAGAGTALGPPAAFVDYGEVQALFSGHCTVCHSPAGGFVPDLSSPASYGDIVNVMDASSNVYVTPSDAANSYLFRKLNEAPPPAGVRMPNGGPYLTPDFQQLVRDWIAQGAHRPAADFAAAFSGSAVAGSTLNVSAQLRDASGQPLLLPGMLVTWTTSGTGGAFGSTATRTDPAGVARTTFTTSTTAGRTYSFTATAGSLTGTSGGITTVAGPAAQYVVTAANPTPLAGDPVGITAQLADASGNPVSTPGKTVSWSAASGSFSFPSSVTNGSGVATVTYTAPTTLGAVTVTGNDGTSQGSVIVTAQGAQYLLSWSPPGAVIVGSTVSVSAQLATLGGSPIAQSGRSVSFSATGVGGTFSPPSAATDASGKATVSFLAGTTAGATTLHAADAVFSGSVGLTTQAGPPAAYVVTPSNPAPVAGTAITVTAQLVDAYGNPVAAARSVTWSTTGLPGNFSANPTSTDASGKASVTFTTNTTAGTTTLQASDGTVSGAGSITSRAGPPAAYVVNASATNVAAGTANISVTAQLVDANGNAVAAARSVTWSTTGLQGSFSQNPTNTNAAGKATSSFTASTSVGVCQLQAGDGTFSGVGPNITTHAGAPAAYVLNVSNPAPVAGTAVTVTAQLVDVYGNASPTAGRSVTWTGSGAAGTFAQNPTTTNAGGATSVSFTTGTSAGTTTIQAADGSQSGSVSLTSTAGAPALYAVNASNSGPVAGTAITLTAQLEDANGNPVALANQSVSWSALGPSGSFAQNPTLTNASGLAQVSFTTNVIAGSVTLRATDGTSTGSVAITSVAGAPSQYRVAVGNTHPAAGTPVSVTAQLADVNGNAVAAAGRSVTWSFSGATGSFSANPTATDATGATGVTFTAPAAPGATDVLTASDGSLSGTSPLITTESGQYLLSYAPLGPVTVGETLTLTAQLADVNGTPIAEAGHSVSFSAGGVGGTFSPSAPQPTDANGRVTVSFTTGTAVGALSVNATDGSLAGSLALTNAPGPAAQYAVAASDYHPVAGDTVALTAQVEDAYGNLLALPGRSVAWSFTGATGAFSATPTSTDATGVASTTFTTNAAAGASDTFTASDGTASGTSPALTTKLGQYLLSNAPSGPLTVGQTVTLTAQLADGSGAPISEAGHAVSFTAGGVGGAFNPTTPQPTDTSGRVSVSFTPSTTAGNVTLHASDGDSSGSLTLSNGPGAPAAYALTVSSAMPVAGSSVTLTAQLRDGYANPVPLAGRSVTWSALGGLLGTFAVNPTLTDANGLAAATFATSATPSSGTVSASDGSVSGTTATIQTATTRYLLAYSPAGAVSAGEGLTLTAQLADASGAPQAQAGRLVTFSATGAGGTFSPATPQATDAQGKATVSFTTGHTAGSIGLSATDGSATGALALTNGPAAPAQYLVNASSYQPPPATGITVTAQLTDAFGNAVPTQGRSVAWSASGAAGQFAATSTLTDATGVATVGYTATAQAAASATVTADDGAQRGTSPPITTTTPNCGVNACNQPGTWSPASASCVYPPCGDGGTDAGVDAGRVAGNDAGSAGPPAPTPSKGCGCAGAPGALLAAFPLLLWALGRRRRR